MPSTVVDMSAFGPTGHWQVLREGGMPEAELEARLEGL